MGWWLTAADELPADPAGSSQSVVVALIAVLGTVLAALITVGIPALLNRARTSESPPLPDPKLGEKVAVIDDRVVEDRRTLAQLDRHVDGIGDQVDKHGWRLDQHDELLGRILNHLGLR